jgi:hypothetical protein
MAESPLLPFRTIAMSKLLILAKKSVKNYKQTREIKASQYLLFLKDRETLRMAELGNSAINGRNFKAKFQFCHSESFTNI